MTYGKYNSLNSNSTQTQLNSNSTLTQLKLNSNSHNSCCVNSNNSKYSKYFTMTTYCQRLILSF